MKAILPIAITDAMLVSCNVPEADYDEWSDDVTYGVGDTRIVKANHKTATVGSNYLASHRGNFIDGNAFFETDSTNLSTVVGTDDGETPYQIEVVDSAGKKAVGYIAGGGLGRVLGNTLILNESFRDVTSWTWGAGWSLVNKRALSANGALLSQDAGLIVDQLYYAGLDVYAFTSGKVSLFYGSSANDFYERVSAASFTEYGMSDGDPDFGANGFGASALTIDNLFVKAVLEPVAAASGGVHIVSALHGTYRGWASVENGFKPYEIATYTITQVDVIYHKIYTSLMAGNLNHFPPNNITGAAPWWGVVGTTNRWKIFDMGYQAQTSNPATIEYSIIPGEYDAIIFLNVDAATIDVVLTDPIEEEVYNEIITMGSDDEASLFDIPVHAAATLSMVISKTGTPMCGEMFVGSVFEIGTTLYPIEIELIDYSKKTMGDDGNYTLTEGAYSWRITYPLMIPNSLIDSIFLSVVDCLSIPVVWVGDPTHPGTIAYGFYKDFSPVIEYQTQSLCRLEIEGLT